jgi:NTP pyrophosphatase (non-canonical NTP hydrolase)
MITILNGGKIMCSPVEEQPVFSKQEEDFIAEFERVSADAHATAREKGFWDKPNMAEKIALVHAELSEVLEALRDGLYVPSGNISSSTVEEELADAHIRLMDFASGFGYSVGPALVEKMRFNQTRQHKHGKRF